MLALAIKNTILVILIILIVHFLIKTFGNDATPTKQPVTSESFAEQTQNCPGASSPQLDEYFGCISKVIDTQIAPSAPKEPLPPVEMQGEESICNSVAASKGTTCDPAFNPIADNAKPIKSECVLDQPNPNAFLILKEYDNENAMNNTRWNDIDLYDEFGTAFMEYASEPFSG